MKGNSLPAVNSILMLRYILGVEGFGGKTALGVVSSRAIMASNSRDGYNIQCEKMHRHKEHIVIQSVIHTVELMYIFDTQITNSSFI